MGSGKWQKITELISSNDGKIRAAKVLLPTKKVLNRPLNLLYPLECDSGREIEMTQDGEQLKDTEEITSTKPPFKPDPLASFQFSAETPQHSQARRKFLFRKKGVFASVLLL